MERLHHEIQNNSIAIRSVLNFMSMLCITIICCTIAMFSVVWWYGNRVDLSIVLLQQADQFRATRTKTVTMAREGRLDASRIRAMLASDPVANAEAIERLDKIDAALADVIESNGGTP